MPPTKSTFSCKYLTYYKHFAFFTRCFQYLQQWNKYSVILGSCSTTTNLTSTEMSTFSFSCWLSFLASIKRQNCQIWARYYVNWNASLLKFRLQHVGPDSDVLQATKLHLLDPFFRFVSSFFIYLSRGWPLSKQNSIAALAFALRPSAWRRRRSTTSTILFKFRMRPTCWHTHCLWTNCDNWALVISPTFSLFPSRVSTNYSTTNCRTFVLWDSVELLPALFFSVRCQLCTLDKLRLVYQASIQLNIWCGVRKRKKSCVITRLLLWFTFLTRNCSMISDDAHCLVQLSCGWIRFIAALPIFAII